MSAVRYLTAALVLIGLSACTVTASTPGPSVGVAVGAVGPPPACPYGWYDFPPYQCAPYGYYGPEWFANGIFIGSGPWYHGPQYFHGYVNNFYDPHRGYNGPWPARGAPYDAAAHAQSMAHFNGNEMRDGRGHMGGPGR